MRFYAIQYKGCYEWILTQPWTQVIDYLLPGLTWYIRLRIGISHLSICGIVVHGRCYISHCFYFSAIFSFSFIFYDCLLVDLCFLVLFWCFLKVVWEPRIHSNLFTFSLIIKLYHYYHGSITSYYIIMVLLHHIVV